MKTSCKEGPCAWCDCSHHDKLKLIHFEAANEAYKAACAEFDALRGLFEDVKWYHFETHAREWANPWHCSLASSNICLHGRRLKLVHRDARLVANHVRKPKYYSGPVSAAPHLPPSVVHAELLEAHKTMRRLESARYDAYTYAPGGKEYLQILKKYQGVKNGDSSCSQALSSRSEA